MHFIPSFTPKVTLSAAVLFAESRNHRSLFDRTSHRFIQSLRAFLGSIKALLSFQQVALGLVDTIPSPLSGDRVTIERFLL